MKNPETDQLLRQQYRWMRLGWPLGVICAGLAATLAAIWFLHPSWARIEQWQRLPLCWGTGVALTLVAALMLLILRRRNLAHSAQKLDVVLNAKNRLETAVAFRDDASPIAQIQREETAAFLSHTPANSLKSLKSHQTPLLLLVGVMTILGLAHFITLISWTRPWVRPPAVAVKPPPATPLPKATITWKTPESETKASPIEEVPLQAVADSEVGLRDLVLELEVNGQPKLQTPISLAELTKKGRHTIDTSVYLDQLEVQPFDIVSYHLRARRIDPRNLPETVSPVQFVEVKPFREDVAEHPPGAGDGGAKGQALIASLKVTQLRLIKENFFLSHAEIGKDNPDWQKENGRVGGDQATLETKTGEIIQQLIESGMPAEIVDLITQARPLMADAAKKINATQNQPALVPQGKALGLITEVEKYIQKVITQANSGKPSPKGPADPFKKQQELEMKQRFQTKAGELELLAREQARLAGDLSNDDAQADPTPTPVGKPDPNRIDGTFPERQTRISQRVAALLNGKTFVPEILNHLSQGHDATLKALRMLDATDAPAAREPAATAARELRLALDEMNQQGAEEAKKQLVQAMQDLNQAAQDARNAPQQSSDQAAKDQAAKAAKQAEKTAQALADAARQQQETGSADEAQQMMEMAKALNDPDMKKALNQLQQQPHDAAKSSDAAERLQQLAERAGKDGTKGQLSPEQIAKLIQQMERTKANIQRLAQNNLALNHQKISASEQETPSSEQKTSASEQKTSASEQKTSASEQKTSASEQKTSASEQKTPASEQKTPASEQGTPASGQGTPASEQNAAPDQQSGSSENQNDVFVRQKGKGSQTGSGPGTGSGQGTGDSGTPDGSNANDADQQEEFAQQLLRELQQESLAADNVIPQGSLHGVLQATPGEQRSGFARLQSFAPVIVSALQGDIDLLRAQMQTQRRQYQLTAADVGQAPEAYRPAVADYFEQLSRDYQAAPTPEDDPKP